MLFLNFSRMYFNSDLGYLADVVRENEEEFTLRPNQFFAMSLPFSLLDLEKSKRIFDEVSDDKESVEAMKVWLLKQKQTQDWKTTKATTEACYALLLRGTDLLSSDELVEIKVGNQLIDPKKMDDVKVEAGTG